MNKEVWTLIYWDIWLKKISEVTFFSEEEMLTNLYMIHGYQNLQLLCLYKIYDTGNTLTAHFEQVDLQFLIDKAIEDYGL